MRAEKQLLLDEIKEKLDSSTAFIVAKYDRLPPNLSWQFRDQLAKYGSVFEVVRKRVFLKAAELSGFKLDESIMKGHIAVVFVQQPDAIQPAKTLFKFAEDNQNLMSVVCGQIEGKIYSGNEVEQLSKLPGINEMRAELLALFVAPLTNTLSIFEAVMSETLSVIEQKSQQQ
jgi:large subunit ribosomal protein L10